jgi:hypothetical protein
MKLGDMNEIVKYHSFRVIQTAVECTEDVVRDLNRYAKKQLID